MLCRRILFITYLEFPNVSYCVCSLHVVQSPVCRISKYHALQTPTAVLERSYTIKEEGDRGSCKGSDGYSLRVTVPHPSTPSGITVLLLKYPWMHLKHVSPFLGMHLWSSSSVSELILFGERMKEEEKGYTGSVTQPAFLLSHGVLKPAGLGRHCSHSPDL